MFPGRTIHHEHVNHYTPGLEHRTQYQYASFMKPRMTALHDSIGCNTHRSPCCRADQTSRYLFRPLADTTSNGSLVPNSCPSVVGLSELCRSSGLA
jgi:hypothetical protein